MCGILCCFYSNRPVDFRERLSLLTPRGPDEMNVTETDNCMMGHTLLSVVGRGSQPIVHDGFIHVHNGEFYDTEQSNDSYELTKMTPGNASDFARMVNGIFAYCSYDILNKRLYVARDPVGVIPLYIAVARDQVWLSSELKALYGLNATVFQPNVLAEYELDGNAKYRYILPAYTKTPTLNKNEIYDLMKASVQKRLRCDVPWACLLSGGLDSSIVAALASICQRPEGYPVLHTYSIGLEDSPDLKYARQVAQHIKSIHHEIHYTVEEGIGAIRDVIYALETYDVTTIRAGVCMFILAKRMRGIRMVLSGEGADELFSGYLYNHFSPSAEELHAECIRKMEHLHLYDCLRCNKAMASNAVECRVPFLDRDVVYHAMNLNPLYKMSSTHPDGKRLEKWYLREAFKDLLPEGIITRQKEQFSDGVGSRWIDSLKEHAEKQVSSKEMENHTFHFQPPKTKEAFYYRTIAHELFGENNAMHYTDETVACSSTTAAKWMNIANDPSGQLCKKRIADTGV